MSKPILTIEGLSVGFGRGSEIEQVTHQVSLSVKKGETLALVGKVALANPSLPIQF